jgi:hypothetical protein
LHIVVSFRDQAPLPGVIFFKSLGLRANSLSLRSLPWRVRALPSRIKAPETAGGRNARHYLSNDHRAWAASVKRRDGFA